MFKYFLTITLRSLSRKGVFSIINILGLSIGLAVVLLISLLNFYELSFDRNFKESDNVFRVNAYMTKITPGETSVQTPNALAPAMEAIPEVLATVRILPTWANLEYNDHAVNFRVVWADEDFFRLFDTPFIYGTPEAVMSRPNVIAIAESQARRIFGNINPVGEILPHKIHDYPPFEVVAVFRDFPENSSFNNFHAIAQFKHHYDQWRVPEDRWFPQAVETFCLLVANADVETVNEKMLRAIDDAIEWEWEEHGYFTPQLQRLTDIHLHSSRFLGTSLMTSLSDVEKVRMMMLMAVIILLVACINYMNLSTARAQKRSKEIGLSKTVGAKRSTLIVRLTLETAIFTFISFVLAWLLAWALLPVFNNLLGEELCFSFALQPVFLGLTLLIWIVTTLLAAAYPALYLSSFPPITATRGLRNPKSSHAVVRKILTVGQFAVAIVLIAWVMIIQTQVTYMNNKDLGFNPRNLLGFWTGSIDFPAIVSEFEAQSSVETVTLKSVNFFRMSAGAQDMAILRDADDKIGFPMKLIQADENYIDLMQIELIAGRRLPPMQQGDTIWHLLVNRAVVDYLGLTPEDAVGTSLPQFGPNIVIHGVMENFHFESLHRPIGGFAIVNPPGGKSFLALRIKEGNLAEQLAIYEEIFSRHTNLGFTPHFLDDYLVTLYESEQRAVRIAMVLSLLAIFIACLGVFGLTAFMAEQRTKEIGIRKISGASLWNIVSLFTTNYVKLLAISLVIAIPVAWYVGTQYLESFAFRISLSWWIFAVSALIVVAITLLTVSLQAIKAAMANPVKSLKTE